MELAATIAALHTYSTDLKMAVTSEAQQARSQGALIQAATAARQTVLDASHDIFGRKIFDPYLRFAYAVDDASYRKREAERKAEIDRAMAEKTPQAALRATDLTIDQLRDAGAHGADRSPEFSRMKQRLEAQKAQLGEALAQSPSPAEKMPEVSPDVIAALRGAGVVAADQTPDGHGLSANQRSQDSGRSPA
jgi:hypothetical protein